MTQSLGVMQMRFQNLILRRVHIILINNMRFTKQHEKLTPVIPDLPAAVTEPHKHYRAKQQ